MKKCSEKLFGYNLEFTRRVGYTGLYAEMIYNSHLLHDAEGFYSTEYEGLKGWGQKSEWIHLLPNVEYVWHVVAGEKVIVRIMPEYGRFIFTQEGAKGIFCGKYNMQNARIEVYSDAPIRYISLKRADSFHNCRRDVLDVMKQLHPTTIRVPGGCYAEVYNWKDGLLPIEERPPICSPKDALFPTHAFYDGHELNIDDYAAVCEYLGAEMEFTVRLTGTAQDAADLVEYCNGDVTTPYGALRAARGHKEPYNVRKWYVGNEIGFLATYEKAVERSDQFTQAMLAVDPTIRTVVSTGNIESWDEQFLKQAKHIDCCSYHDYMYEHMPEWELADLLNKAPAVLFESIKRAAKRADGKPILFDEWNMCWGYGGDSATALYAAAVMTMLMHHADELNVAGASYFAIVNEGAIRVYPDHVLMAPDGEVLARMREHGDGEILPTDDRTMVQTCHEDHLYTSVYNPDVKQDKALCGITGEYTVLTPNGITFDIRNGKGVLDVIPPASVAFIRTDL